MRLSGFLLVPGRIRSGYLTFLRQRTMKIGFPLLHPQGGAAGGVAAVQVQVAWTFLNSSRSHKFWGVCGISGTR